MFPSGAVRVIAATVLCVVLLAVPGAAEATFVPEDARTVEIDGADWTWPVTAPFRLDRPYVQPAHAYAPGHRGIDLLIGGDTGVGAPDDGVVVFVGRVVDRGVVTIDHGGGIVSTLEPVDASVEVGARVRRGERVGTLSLGGHALPGRLHLGARLDGLYVNPLLLLGGVPRAVLLPCCS